MPGSLAARPGRNIATMTNVPAVAAKCNTASPKDASNRSLLDIGQLNEARIRSALVAHYAAPEARDEAVRRMARPETRQKIAERTAAALASPEVKRRHDGLARAWNDPAKREAQRLLTIERMAAWLARKLAEAQKVLAHLPKAERAVALASLLPSPKRETAT